MKLRIPRRALLAFLAAVALPAAVPVSALATTFTPTLTVTPSSLAAGGDPSITSDAVLLPSGSATESANTVSLALPPGLLTSATANVSCLTPMPTGSCVIGSGTITATEGSAANAIPVTLTLGPPPAATDLAGVTIADSAPYAALTIPPAPISAGSTGSLTMSATLPNLTASNIYFTELDLTLNGTLGGNAFTRMPTSCGPATTTLTVTYYNGTPQATATGAFTPTGCSALPFSPVLHATATKDMKDDFVQVTTGTTQAAGQAADKTLALTVPAAVSPNATNAVAALTSGTSVGVATATSPLFPTALSGTVTLTGTAFAPDLTVTFPAPFPLVLQGAVSLTSSSVTFSDVPDAPLSSLAVTLNGGTTGLYQTSCTPSSGTLLGNFTAQDGATATSNVALAVSGCSTTTPPPTPTPTVGKPTVSGTTLAGLVKNKGKLAFTATEGTNAKPISTIAISLPKGVTFSKKAKNLKKGIRVSGAKFTYKVSHGVLTIKLSSAVKKAKVTLASPAISVSSKLAASVKSQLKKKKVSSLSFKLKLTDSAMTATTIKLGLKPKS